MSVSPISAKAMAQLLRLASPMLPVGAYAYSQGMEWAVEEGAITDEESAQAWIADLLCFNIGTLEAPVWRRLYGAWQERDIEAARHWNERFIAIRETAEFRAETLQMGGALKAVLDATREIDTGPLDQIESPAFPTAFSFAAHGLGVPLREGLTGYLWAWGRKPGLGGDEAGAARPVQWPAHPGEADRAITRNCRERTRHAGRPAEQFLTGIGYCQQPPRNPVHAFVSFLSFASPSVKSGEHEYPRASVEYPFRVTKERQRNTKENDKYKHQWELKGRNSDRVCELSCSVVFCQSGLFCS